MFGIEFTAAGDTGPLWRVNEHTGAGTPVGLTGFSKLNSLAADAVGHLYTAGLPLGGAVDNALIVIDPLTGIGTQVATINLQGHAIDIRSLAFAPDGSLYAVNNQVPFQITPQDLYRINPATGVGTFIATLSNASQSLDFDAAGNLWGYNGSNSLGLGNGIGLMCIDPQTGAVTDVNPSVDGLPDVQSIVFGPDGTLYGAGAVLYHIDKTTGATQVIGGGGYGQLRGVEFVPEPGGMLLMGSTLLLGLASRRRRRCI